MSLKQWFGAALQRLGGLLTGTSPEPCALNLSEGKPRAAEPEQEYPDIELWFSEELSKHYEQPVICLDILKANMIETPGGDLVPGACFPPQGARMLAKALLDVADYAEKQMEEME